MGGIQQNHASGIIKVYSKVETLENNVYLHVAWLSLFLDQLVLDLLLNMVLSLSFWCSVLNVGLCLIDVSINIKVDQTSATDHVDRAG